MVSDEEIMAAYGIMARKAGIFGEPASAAPLAGLLKMKQNGQDFSGKVIACVVTGTGLKDADTAIKDAECFIETGADIKSVEKALGLK